MKTVLFYSSVQDKSLFQTQKFYQIDIDILKRLGYNVILSNKIWDALKFWKYDFVFAYFFRYSLFVAAIAKLFGKKSYLTGGIDALDKNFASERSYKIQKYLFKLCYLFTTKCIIVSSEDMKHVKEIMGKHIKKLVYSEHTIETLAFAGFNMSAKEKMFTTIGWQGVISDRKGIDKAIILFGLLSQRSEFADYALYILGRKGAYTPVLQKIIDDHHLTDKVIITGEVTEDEKINYLKRSRYYFQLSKYEGFGIAALEALIAGNVVLHSGKGGLANPIYNSHVKVEIDADLESQVQRIADELSAINYDDISRESAKCRLYYDNKRRMDDLSKVLPDF